MLKGSCGDIQVKQFKYCGFVFNTLTYCINEAFLGFFLDCLKTAEIVPVFKAKIYSKKIIIDQSVYLLFYLFLKEFHIVFVRLIAHGMLFLDYCNPGITNLKVVGWLKQYLGTLQKLITAYHTTY